jgi:ferric-dicitrate binding protein FerR (iron transport regulator)
MAGCSPTRECPAVTFQTMNKPTNMVTSVREQAFDWYAALKSRDRIQELWPSFEEWLENPQHKEMYLWIERIAQDARDLAESCEESSDINQPSTCVPANNQEGHGH